MVEFGSGELFGHFVIDDVRLGGCSGAASGQIHIKNQKFGRVELQKTIFTGKNFEAIVGLAYPTLAEPGVTPVFDQAAQQNLLKHKMFAFFLTSRKDELLKGFQSDLTFGYYDRAKYTGDIHWNDILYKFMFGVKLNDILVNGKSLNLCEDRDCLITFDSGTSGFSIPNFAATVFEQ